MAAWRALALQRVKMLEDQLTRLERTTTDGARLYELDELRGELGAARTALDGGRESIVSRLTGTAVNVAWAELHRIEERVEEYKTSTDLLADARQHVRTDLVGARANQLTTELDRQAPDQRDRSLRAIHEAHDTAETRHLSEHNQQLGIVMICLGMFATALVVFAVQLIAGDRFHIIPPAAGAGLPPAALLGLVMFFGMVGGAVSALLSLYVSSKEYTNTKWFDPRPALTVVKVALGLWTAVIGILAVASGIVVGVYTSTGSALFLAFLFGYGQQAVTTFIDKRVADLAAAKKS